MKRMIWLMCMAPLALTACQDQEKAQPIAQAPAAMSDNATVTPSSMVKVPSEMAEKTVTEAVTMKPAATTDTVAVTKPEEMHTAASVAASMDQAKQDAAAAVAALNAPALPATIHSVTKPAVKQAAAKAIKVKTVAKKAVDVVIAKPKVTVPTLAKAALPKVAKPMMTAATGDAVKGKKLAKKCMACHSFTAKKKMGPGLKGVVGRKAGSMTGMRYSSALAAGTWSWDEKHLAAWLCNSKAAVKIFSGDNSAKTKMPSQRICDATKQTDLIAFLKTL